MKRSPGLRPRPSIPHFTCVFPPLRFAESALCRPESWRGPQIGLTYILRARGARAKPKSNPQRQPKQNAFCARWARAQNLNQNRNAFCARGARAKPKRHPQKQPNQNALCARGARAQNQNPIPKSNPIKIHYQIQNHKFGPAF